MKDIAVVVSGVRAYLDENNTAWINLEDATRGLGFIEVKNGVEYVRWRTIREYLRQFNFSQEVAKNNFIPENIFYRLAMKAKNETAEKFQSLVADEIIPAILKTGSYSVKSESREELIARALIASQSLVDELKGQVAVMTPKARIYDKIIDTENLIPWRVACKLIRWATGTMIKENKLREYLLNIGWIYQKSYAKYEPYTSTIDNGYMTIRMEACKDGVLRECNCFTMRGIRQIIEKFDIQF